MKIRVLVMISAFCGQIALGQAPQTIQLRDPLPYGQKPLDYFGEDTADFVARHREKLLKRLSFQKDAPQGYLPSLLKALDISTASQVLVFSKTALNPKLVSPNTPRAVFFNEQTYVGYVPGAASLEIAAVDPVKGWIFYTLPQPEYESKSSPKIFQRERQCLACHAGQSSLRIPGGVVRGFVTDRLGNPRSGYSRITHETPLTNRFGGWYVTSDRKQPRHRGNQIEAPASQMPLVSAANQLKNVKDLVDVSRYPSDKSDLVVQLLLHHQVHGQNLLIRVGHESRIGRRSEAEKKLIRYLVFADEAELPGPIKIGTEFGRWFEQRGQRDSTGRSLRRWNLQNRLFEYRLSYLIESELFDNLPKSVKRRLYDVLFEGLSAASPTEPFDHIPLKERQTILGIVRDIKHDLPAEWQELR